MRILGGIIPQQYLYPIIIYIIKLLLIVAYLHGKRIGRIAGHNGMTNADFVRFGSCDRTNAFVVPN